MDAEQTLKPTPPAQVAGDEQRVKRSFWKRRPVIALGTCALAGLFLFGLRYLAESFTHESTDDAFLSADVVSLAPQVAGQVTRVLVEDNQRVNAGDLLLRIDPRNFEVQVEQKKAALASAEANVQLLIASVQLLGTQVGTAEATVKQSEAEAEADKATADKAQADLQRAEELIQKRIISPSEYDAAKAAAAAATATWKAGEEKAASDRSKVAQAQAQLQAGRRAWDRAQAQAKQSTVDVQQADLNLSYTRVTAPVAGRVTRKAVEDGDYVQVGQKLMAIVPDQVWVTANFKETQLKNIHTNQPVEIHIDSVAGRPFVGHVQSIQAGSGAAFSLLPPENAVGNFVKVVQRVPVKIVFDQSPETHYALGPGMSVEPSVRVSNVEIPVLVLALVAVGLACLAGWLWWRAANRQPQSG
jgi:membrane fusion protein, multidrug efflux system